MRKKTGTETCLQDVAHLVLPYLRPSSLAAIAAASKSLRHLSATITALRSSDAARDLEPHPIPFRNPHSPSPPYSFFLYSPDPFLPPHPYPLSWPSNHPSSSSKDGDFELQIDGIGGAEVGCWCGETCGPEDCPCWGTDSGRECGRDCGCDVMCENRKTQRGVGVRLRIVWDERKGWGLFSDEFISRGRFVCQYAGEYITTTEARKRQNLYDELASTGRFSPALLVVREHLPSGKACLRVNIDATKVGNVARFINHSCDGGNLSTVLVRNSGLFLPRLCFFASVDICEGEELTFSYGDTNKKEKGLPCFCGSSNCRGILPSEAT